jgi:hypothetical protein
MGFQGINSDHCYLELIRSGTEFIKMVFHVDDFLVAQQGDQLWGWYMQELNKHYKFSVAPLNHYLGMRFQRMSNGAYAIDQEVQIDKMLRAFNLSSCDTVATPVHSFRESDRLKLADVPTSDAEKISAAKLPYPQAIGHLTYLTQCTHFEVMLPVRLAASFTKAWGTRHWQWVKHIMLYLKSKATKLIIRGGSPRRNLLAWSDADHVGNPDNRRSMAAGLLYLGEDIIDWYCKQEQIVAHSSAESELMALDLCARHLTPLRWKLEAIVKLPPSEPAVIHMDSSSAIQMAQNPIQNGRNRHIHARYFFVRDLIEANEIILVKVPTEENRADLLATYKDASTFRSLLVLCKSQL